MKKVFIKYFFFLLINLSGFIAFAQVSIKGNVTDAATGLALQGATIKIQDLNLITTSDKKGNYIFNDIKAGTYILDVSFLGYKVFSQSVTTVDGLFILNFKLHSMSVNMDSVVVSATLTEKNVKDIPASIGIVTKDQIENLPGITTDEYLNSVTGIYDSRHYGIFYQSGDIFMRGLNRNVYTLLLIDGIPASIVDGGSTNWDRIDPDNIERIEVIKGPNSSLYGSNAMGGVINIITKHPLQPFTGEVSVFYGTDNTYGGNFILNGRKITNDKGFYWRANGMVRQSDGYVLLPAATADSTDVKTYLKEYDGSLRCGYSFKKNNNIEMQVDLSDETFGLGKKIFEPEGNYNNSIYQFWQARYKGQVGKVKISAMAFYKIEWDNQQRESIKQSGAYTLYNTDATSADKGLWCNASIPVRNNQNITIGFDSKLGEISSSDIYRTSTDTVAYKGNLNYYGLFAQDDIDIIKDKLKAIAGLRYDLVNFYNAAFSINDPSATTSFILPYIKPMNKETWTALSPKAGLLYKFSNSINAYLDASRGFRSGTISDLCQTADVSQGFKIANPALKPEYLSNIEAGSIIQLGKFEIEPILFYSIGKDFQYFLGTGDSIYTLKTKEEPIIERENINKVVIYGAELSANYSINHHITLFANYTYDHAQISDFDTNSTFTTNLTNKLLSNSPMNIAYSGIQFKTKIINFSITYRYVSSIWADDANTQKVDGYSLFDAKVSKTFYNKLRLSVMVQNIFNNLYLDSKGNIPPGRFITVELKYNF